MSSAGQWAFLPVGYALTVAIELPILLLMLSPVHSLRRRVFAGFWLTACTYPIVILFLPVVLDAGQQTLRYIVVAETFAPLAECVLFYGYCRRTPEAPAGARDFAAVVFANLASFLTGEGLRYVVW